MACGRRYRHRARQASDAGGSSSAAASGTAHARYQTARYGVVTSTRQAARPRRARPRDDSRSSQAKPPANAASASAKRDAVRDPETLEATRERVARLECCVPDERSDRAEPGRTVQERRCHHDRSGRNRKATATSGTSRRARLDRAERQEEDGYPLESNRECPHHAGALNTPRRREERAPPAPALRPRRRCVRPRHRESRAADSNRRRQSRMPGAERGGRKATQPR